MDGSFCARPTSSRRNGRSKLLENGERLFSLSEATPWPSWGTSQKLPNHRDMSWFLLSNNLDLIA
jgi:hypothetical protein